MWALNNENKMVLVNSLILKGELCWLRLRISSSSFCRVWRSLPFGFFCCEKNSCSSFSTRMNTSSNLTVPHCILISASLLFSFSHFRNVRPFKDGLQRFLICRYTKSANDEFCWAKSYLRFDRIFNTFHRCFKYHEFR